MRAMTKPILIIQKQTNQPDKSECAPSSLIRFIPSLCLAFLKNVDIVYSER